MENIQKGHHGHDDNHGPLPIERWTISYNKCNGCGDCVDACTHLILKIEQDKVVITDETQCTQCAACVNACIFRAIVLT